jgi:hypothetical protein
MPILNLKHITIRHFFKDPEFLLASQLVKSANKTIKNILEKYQKGYQKRLILR